MSSNYIAEKGVWKLTKFTLLLTSRSQIADFLCTFGTIMEVIVGLVWFGLYICPINQTCTYDWAKEKILIHYIGELAYAKRTSRNIIQTSSSLEHFFFYTVDDCVYLIGDFI